MLVYKITNCLNNKCYIGITERSLEERWKGHLSCAKNNVNRHLYCAMRKYGVENFSIEVLEDNIDDYNVLLEKEIFYIDMFNSANIDYGYNMTFGGDTNPMDCSVSKDKHNKIMCSEDVRNKISNSMKIYRATHPFTDEHRKRLSESAKGNHNFGSGDTRSVECYCILENGEKHYFHNYKIAGKWWFDTFHPFGNNYSEATFQRKIKASISGDPIKYRKGTEIYVVTNIRWYKGGDVNE